MCILSVMYVTLKASEYKHITFDGLVLEEISKFQLLLYYITDYGYPLQIVVQSGIRMTENNLRTNLRLKSLISINYIYPPTV